MTVAALSTPMMQQFLKVKSLHPDAVVFYRMGDFYEMFLEDAVLAAPLLDIALTTRDKGKPDAVPMCGVPVHAADGHIKRLAELGHRVAICEQVEDPRELGGRRLVRREVVEVVTPGLVGDPDGLDGRTVVALAALCLPDPAGSSTRRTIGAAGDGRPGAGGDPALRARRARRFDGRFPGDRAGDRRTVWRGDCLRASGGAAPGALPHRAARDPRPGLLARGFPPRARGRARRRRRHGRSPGRLRIAAELRHLAGNGADRWRFRRSRRPGRRELPGRESTLRRAAAAAPGSLCALGHRRPRRGDAPSPRALRER